MLEQVSEMVIPPDSRLFLLLFARGGLRICGAPLLQDYLLWSVSTVARTQRLSLVVWRGERIVRITGVHQVPTQQFF
jgi:hypothetical protein